MILQISWTLATKPGIIIHTNMVMIEFENKHCFDNWLICQWLLLLIRLIKGKNHFCYLKDGCCYQYERNQQSLTCSLHHPIHTASTRPHDQPGHWEGVCERLENTPFYVILYSLWSLCVLLRWARSAWLIWQEVREQTHLEPKAWGWRCVWCHISFELKEGV